MRKFLRSPVFWVVVALLAFLIVSSFMRGGSSVEKPTLDAYLAQVDKGDVRTADLIGNDEVKGEYTNGKKYEVGITPEFSDEMTNRLLEAKVVPKVTEKPKKDNVWLSILINFLPFILLLAGFLFIVNTMQGGGNRVIQFGKAKAKTVNKDQPKVTFADVAGADEAVQELQEIKEFLEAPAKFQSIGAKIPKGVLLFGPPGTGKTLLARAVAGEAGVPFFSISGSDFVEMFVGVGASRVRDLFEQAKTNAPAIIFMDEIDAVGRHRGAGLGGGHDEREQTLNQLLVSLDGF